MHIVQLATSLRLASPGALASVPELTVPAAAQRAGELAPQTQNQVAGLTSIPPGGASSIARSAVRVDYWR